MKVTGTIFLQTIRIQDESMILITGASGKTGKTLIRNLLRHGIPVRAFVHRVDQQAELSALGLTDILVGDMRQPADLMKAAAGVETIYHIPPNMSPDEVSIGQKVIEAARTQNVQRLVYHSVLHPQVEQMSHHWSKSRVEEMLFTSGLGFTILQPTAYMQNMLAYWPSIVSNGIYALPYSADTRLSLVDLEDVAAVAERVILEPGFENGIYELVGTPAYSQKEIAQVLSEKVGRPVRVDTLSRTAWEENARRSGMNDYAVRTLLSMFEYYEKYGMAGNPAVLTWLLNRKPATFPQFIDRILPS
jgi:NAD(P)H dehydrogenase (quinone)